METARAEEGEAVNVAEVDFAGLRGGLVLVQPELYVGIAGEARRTNSKKKPKSRKNSIGPARSESSMIC